ncbi:nucleoside hydrolase [Paralimibaculum aggregatum]|uniref:Nucleoside hydrolase n=1 Tax=Paralimibaculum aggregatum TaxID=3036245 RepID=A0ABQ6LLI4_9RHOB|nr:nucleoside hydrolase [Limibaculum sp. NKW23]GMG81160.1 nucleoside hydrolase [Limibaculum sp. NKW23]
MTETPAAIVIDTDPGVDDAMAILYALADPEIELLGLTTVFGNVPEPVATRNALQLALLAGAPALPVAAGAARPRLQPPRPFATDVHGADGLGTAVLPPLPPGRLPDPRPAARFLAETCAARPGEVTIVAVGPLTNLAAALDVHPAIARQARGVIVMGGALRQKGNVTPFAEANIHQDPHAAAAVFAAPWAVTLVGLDVTERVILTAADLAPMVARSPRCGALLAEAAEFYFAFHKASEGLDGCHLHDPTAVIAALRPELFRTAVAPVEVTVRGPEAGRTREAPEAAARPLTLCLGVDAPAVRARFLEILHAGRLP